MSIPSPMDNIVDNLQSKDSPSYIDVRSLVLQLSSFSHLSSNGKGLNTHSHKVNKFNNKKKNSENPTLLELRNPNLPMVTSAPIARNISTLIRVTHISSTIDSTLPAITLPVLHLLMYSQPTSFLIFPT